jgi:CRISPR/Cas system-associated endonuclease Cas1
LLEEKASYHLSQYEEYSDDLEPKKIRELLNRADWSDDRIWQTLIEICDERIEHHKEQILALEKEKEKNRLRLQVLKKLGSIPSKDELDRLLRYEGAIERQLYKAMNQLERLQRMRSGDNVPAPVEVDVNTSQSG